MWEWLTANDGNWLTNQNTFWKLTKTKQKVVRKQLQVWLLNKITLTIQFTSVRPGAPFWGGGQKKIPNHLDNQSKMWTNVDKNETN